MEDEDTSWISKLQTLIHKRFPFESNKPEIAREVIKYVEIPAHAECLFRFELRIDPNAANIRYSVQAASFLGNKHASKKAARASAARKAYEYWTSNYVSADTTGSVMQQEQLYPDTLPGFEASRQPEVKVSGETTPAATACTELEGLVPPIKVNEFLNSKKSLDDYISISSSTISSVTEQSFYGLCKADTRHINPLGWIDMRIVLRETLGKVFGSRSYSISFNCEESVSTAYGMSLLLSDFSN